MLALLNLLYTETMSRTRLVIELDEDLATRLEAATAESRTSVETFVAKAVARAVADIEAWAEDEAAYAEYEHTGEAIPLAAVEDWVKSWGTANELPPPAPCKSSS
jgi:predicted transcriptional regulator